VGAVPLYNGLEQFASRAAQQRRSQEIAHRGAARVSDRPQRHEKLSRELSENPGIGLLALAAGRLRLGVLSVVLLGLLSTGAMAATVEGLWLVEDGDAVIKIATCGSALCGLIVGIARFSPDGSPPKDNFGRSQCGLEIIHALVQSESDRWFGTITNPEDGRTYKVRLSLDDAARLRLRGYLGIPLFGSTQIWTAYSGTLTADCRMTH
jgi:uncharacterized protein (DUF2147 family)